MSDVVRGAEAVAADDERKTPKTTAAIPAQTAAPTTSPTMRATGDAALDLEAVPAAAAAFWALLS